MKRILNIIPAAFLFLLIPFSLVTGQEKKSEQKIKIVVNDGSGTRVVVDTLFKDSPKPDSIKLKDGTVIYLKHAGDETNVTYHTGKDHFYITASVDNSQSHEGKGGGKYKVITRNSNADGDKGEMIYINKADSQGQESDYTFDMYVSDNDTIEKSRYVIAKDGIVVTVEGNDEAKTKELVKEIESKLGVNSEVTQKKETINVESKKQSGNNKSDQF